MRTLLLLPAALALGALVSLASSACSSDGATPSCPELTPLYDVRDSGGAIPEQRAEAISAGCVTAPGTATNTPPPAPDAGDD